VSAIGQKFHVECFTCFHCHKPIHSGLFHLESGNPYCDEGMVEIEDHCKQLDIRILLWSYKLISCSFWLFVSL